MNFQNHPNYLSFCRRIKNLPKGSSAQFSGILFRFVRPRYATNEDAISGLGALKASGRWHTQRQFLCVYTSTTPETALQEMLAANRYNGLQDHRSLPSLLLAMQAELFHLLDLTNGKIRQRLRISKTVIRSCDWRDSNRNEAEEAITQALGRAAFDLGYEGIIAPSTADHPNGRNLVVFPSKLIRSEGIKIITPVPKL